MYLRVHNRAARQLTHIAYGIRYNFIDNSAYLEYRIPRALRASAVFSGCGLVGLDKSPISRLDGRQRRR